LLGTTYVVVDVAWRDGTKEREVREKYIEGFAPALTKYRGRTVASSLPPTVVEGPWNLHRVVTIQFASTGAFWKWYRSPEYAALLSLRKRAARTKIILVEGIPLAVARPPSSHRN
jgi:uncharacterized protein (DUF1330 family)